MPPKQLLNRIGLAGMPPDIRSQGMADGGNGLHNSSPYGFGGQHPGTLLLQRQRIADEAVGLIDVFVNGHGSFAPLGEWLIK